MVILKTRHWWENSVAIVATSHPSCNPPKIISGWSKEIWFTNYQRALYLIRSIFVNYVWPWPTQIIFHRFVTNYAESGKGFKVEYEVTYEPQWTHSMGACGGTFKTENGLLTSPSYPENYRENADCIYLISQPNGTYINIKFMTMDISCMEENGTSDYVEIRDGNSGDSPLMGKFCGYLHRVPNFLQTSQSHLRIR